MAGGGPGVGTRPYRDGDATFEKQKVRGKMQSGAITGLSHFRGQGAKGDAPKEYVSALKSAAQEATSPIELDRIPADARVLVKNYFSKLEADAGNRIKSAVAPTPPGQESVEEDAPQDEALRE